MPHSIPLVTCDASSLKRRSEATFPLNTTTLSRSSRTSESRLISPAFVVPSADQNPRLRFWQWFSFGGAAGYPYNDDGSYGYVEVKVGTNGWQTVTSRYVNEIPVEACVEARGESSGDGG